MDDLEPLNIFIEMKNNIILKEHESLDGTDIIIPVFDEGWEEENLSTIVYVSKGIPPDMIAKGSRLEGCTTDETVYVLSAMDSSLDNLRGRLCASALSLKHLCKSDLFAVLEALECEAGVHASESSLEKYRALYDACTKGAKKGGQALQKDNLPFKKKYRELRDEPTRQGQTRADIVDLAGAGLDAPYSSFERWAKAADKEDGYIRKRGRPSKRG